MTLLNRDEGRHGEDIACEYLKTQGFKIIDRNFRIRGGEIDIIAIDQRDPSGSILVFIEVKTRKSSAFGSPLEAISYWKIKALMKAAEFYKMTHPHLPDSMRLDAVAIILDISNNVISIELVKNIA